REVRLSGATHETLPFTAVSARSSTRSTLFPYTTLFRSKASDGSAASTVVAVSLTVNSVNDAPVAAGDSYSLAEDSVLSVAASGVLASEHDGDGDALAAGLVSGPAHDSLTLNANGSFTYT